MDNHEYDAIVIGSGVGGITCGSLLAKRGLKTIVLENHDTIGGFCSTFEDQGFHFDTGACLVEFMQIYDTIFEALGKKKEDCIDFRPCDPIYSFRTPEGEYLDIPTDIQETHDVIKQYSRKDAKNWLKYCDFWRELNEGSMEKYVQTDMQSWKSLLKMSDWKSLKFLPVYLTTYEILIKKWFSHQTTLDAFGFQSYWMGLPPKLCPGLYAGINYGEHEGIFYPMGGMISIPKSILTIGQEYGLELQLNTRVSKVIAQNGKARGVELADGTKLSSKIVVSNVNAKTLYLDLIGEENLPRGVVKGVKSYKLSMASPQLYLGIKGDVPLRGHHSLQLRPFQKMNSMWDELFVKKHLLDDPTCLISWPTETDPSLAPEGHHAVTVMSNGPYELDHGTWDDRREEFIDQVLGFVDKTLWPGISDQIVYKKLTTPLDFERTFLSPHGAVYALQNDIPSTMIFRPANRSKSIEGLYLVGASTHPGGGVPMVAASGKLSADLIMADLPSL